MLFNSLSFFIFFPAVAVLYFLLPQRFRTVWLLAASAVFYMAFIPAYILILLVTISIDYYAGIKIERSAGRKKKIFLIVSIISTCAVLFVFKYFNFFNFNVNALARFLHWNYSLPLLGLILPIGLSFHTFQSLSYVIEVYRGRQPAERNFLTYSLYVMFFPQLVAGPIERPQNLLRQFYERHVAEYGRIADGLKKMALGFFKKMLIADNLAVYVNQVYNRPQHFQGLTLLVATFFFALQIYCDFSGYSDIAIGSAQVLGFRLMENFKNPYFSSTIAEFWTRWHISLSSWFRDYVYIPLGGNRVSRARWCGNILAVFLISGLWHGASWTYLIWGGIHGAYLICSRLGSLIKWNLLPRLARRIVVFILVLLAWVFFRANSLSDAIYVLGHLSFQSAAAILDPLSALNHGWLYLWFLFGLVGLFLAVEIIDYRSGVINSLNRQRAWVRWLIYFGVILLVINFGAANEAPFIYFQF